MSEWTPADVIALTRAATLALGGDPGPHPHIDTHDLSPEIEALVGRHVFRYLDEGKRRGRTSEFDKSLAYLAALGDFGIDCPHVPKEGSRFARCRWFVLECRHCGTVVVRAREAGGAAAAASG